MLDRHLQLGTNRAFRLRFGDSRPCPHATCSGQGSKVHTQKIKSKFSYSSLSLDHTDYIAPRYFMWVTEILISQGPTPAVWPKGGTLSFIGGPCLSGASWSALLRLASVRSHEARRGVTGFGSFCRNKRASSAGAKPGFTENHVDMRVGTIRYVRYTYRPALFRRENPTWIPHKHRYAARPKP